MRELPIEHHAGQVIGVLTEVKNWKSLLMMTLAEMLKR